MGPFCHDGDFWSGIPNLASDRRLDHCRVGEVSADSLHSGSCSWRITPEPASVAVLVAASTGPASALANPRCNSDSVSACPRL